MNKNYIWIAAIVVVGLGIWWWSSTANAPAPAAPYGATDTNSAPQQAAATPSTTPTTTQGSDGTGPSQNLVLGISHSAALGTYLTAYNGMTLYTYAKDAAGVSNCSGSCAANWPPYTVGARDAINVPATITGKVSTLTRADGSLQITYNGRPLYFYQPDAAPGDTKGQGVGGVWYVVKP